MAKARAMRRDPVQPSFLSASEARSRASERALTPGELAVDLLPWAEGYASAPISSFRVGAVAVGLSGAMYAGANLEFPGESLSLSVHAEQSAVYNAWVHGETGVALIATTAPPCGYCRQFLNELAGASDLRVAVRGRTQATLAELLPAAFGPRDLGLGEGGLMNSAAHALVLDGGDAGEDPVAAAALAAACRTYAPYSGTYAGVGLRLWDGTIVQGRYAENAAFNPTLSPMQTALIELALAGKLGMEIEEAVLVAAAEPNADREDGYLVSQWASSTAILSSVAPQVPLTYLHATPVHDDRHGAGLGRVR